MSGGESDCSSGSGRSSGRRRDSGRPDGGSGRSIEVAGMVTCVVHVRTSEVREKMKHTCEK